MDLGLLYQALVSGALDLYPEYSGTVLTAILKLPPNKDARAVFNRVKAEYATRWPGC